MKYDDFLNKYIPSVDTKATIRETGHRVNLNPIEEAKAYYALITKYDDSDPEYNAFSTK